MIYRIINHEIQQIRTRADKETLRMDKDSIIKELNLANQSIDEISNMLKEVKELHSKRK